MILARDMMEFLSVKRFAAIAAATALIAYAFLGLLSRGSQSILIADAAQVDYFLKIDGIEGESTDDRHEGEIDIESFSWGVMQKGIFTGGGGGGGKAGFDVFKLMKRTDKSSPVLFQSAASGMHHKDAVLIGRNVDGFEFMKIKMTDVLISSYAQSGGQADVPTDSFSLNFAKIEFDYMTQEEEGGVGETVHGGWDLKMNRAI